MRSWAHINPKLFSARSLYSSSFATSDPNVDNIMPYYAVCAIGAISIAAPGLERHRSGIAAAFLGRDFAPVVCNNAAEGLLSKGRVPRAFVTDSHQVLDPFRFLLIAVAGWMNQQQQSAIASSDDIMPTFLNTFDFLDVTGCRGLPLFSRRLGGDSSWRRGPDRNG